MSSTPLLPIPSHPHAPRFDPESRRAAFYYFVDFDSYFARAHITGDQTKKKLACRYAGVQRDLWETLPEAAPHVPYADFVAAVLAHYPSARPFRFAELRAFVHASRAHPIDTVADLAQYNRAFLRLALPLLRTRQLEEHEASRWFASALPRTLWNRISRRLDLRNPDRDPEDLPLTDDIVREGVYDF